MAVHIQRFGAAGGRGFQTVIKHSCVVAMLGCALRILVWFGVDTASQFWRQKY